jgi:hypothetical protein
MRRANAPSGVGFPFGLSMTLPLTGLQCFGAYAPEPVIIANVTGERVKRPWDQGTPGVASSINHLPTLPNPAPAICSKFSLNAGGLIPPVSATCSSG